MSRFFGFYKYILYIQGIRKKMFFDILGKNGRVAERFIALVLKTSVLKGTVGSNPTSSAKLPLQLNWLEQLICNQQVIGSIPVRGSDASVAQLVEQWSPKPKVRGSIPLGRATASIAQLVERLPAKQGVVGSRPSTCSIAIIAQLVEHYLAKVKVVGSRPIYRSSISRYSAVWQRICFGSRGSQVRILSLRPFFK